jgi:5-methyltetrahydrofolate--homocysteine methyltransferase
MSSPQHLLSRAQRTAALLAVADQRILVLDGATGTALQDMNLTPADFGGPELEGCNENLVRTRPDIVARVHEMYLEAGCDIVETNTFGATPLVLGEYGLSEFAYELNREAARIARETCARFDSPSKTRFVAGAIGPTTKALSVTGGTTFEELEQNFHLQAAGLFDGGADYFLVETCQDTRNIKAALLGIERLFRERGERIPTAVSATIENSGTMLAGQTVEALVASLQNHDLFYLGLNCATGPAFMTDHIRSLAKLSPFRVACLPNAGLPDENGRYLETPEMVGGVLARFIQEGWINLIGGCCGTVAQHVREFVRIAEGVSPRMLPARSERRSNLSGVDYLEITDELRPVLVGERTNMIGSRKFKDLISAEKFDEASEIAKNQVKAGAHIIDICLSTPDRDEVPDVERFLEKVIHKVRVPLMIDSTDTKVIARALTYCQGKAIINSINLEDGEERYEQVVPLAKAFGAALVVGTIDEDPQQGMAVTAARKLQIAERSHKLLTEKYGFPEEDIYFDPLVFPCASGDEQYRGSARETIEGVGLIKQRFPRCKTVLGISNVSFGLPAASREVLNSVFLYHCVQAGLDLAIVNSEKLERFGSLPLEEVSIAENLLFDRVTPESPDPIAAFAAAFRERKAKVKPDRSSVPLDRRLALCVIEGSKDGLIEDLDEALKERAPLDIINGPLMAGMDEVGRLFNANKLIVAEVLQSAEVMKAAVSYLEPRMEKLESAMRGKVMLATVKGDVHDIGKNLVDIILSNNGFHVINLGIKVPPEKLIEAAHQHKPDIIGLSGLLVKSAQQMVTTAEDLARAGVQTPILVGGAALSRNFTEKRILPAYDGGAVLYAQDAMNGLELAGALRNPVEFEKIKIAVQKKRAEVAAAAQAAGAGNANTGAGSTSVVDATGVGSTGSIDPKARRSPTVRVLDANPQPPDFERHIQTQVPLEQIWKFINPLMLYTRHLGVKARSARQFELLAHDPVAARKLKLEDPAAYDIWEKVEEVKAEFKNNPALQPRAVYRFFRAAAEGETVFIYGDHANSHSGSNSNSSSTGARPIAQFTFGRQTKGSHLCLADYVSAPGGPSDSIALFLTSVGEDVRGAAAQLKDRGEYLKSHILQALAIESAEAYAELLHTHLRSAWGCADPATITMLERFQAKYRGKRFSFGYPACPRLEDQTILFELLNPQDIGVELTEGFMMDPESSVSAIVFHHPDAKYFAVAGGDSMTGDALPDSI